MYFPTSCSSARDTPLLGRHTPLLDDHRVGGGRSTPTSPGSGVPRGLGCCLKTLGRGGGGRVRPPTAKKNPAGTRHQPLMKSPQKVNGREVHRMDRKRPLALSRPGSQPAAWLRTVLPPFPPPQPSASTKALGKPVINLHGHRRSVTLRDEKKHAPGGGRGVGKVVKI